MSEQHIKRDGVNRSKSMKHACLGWVTSLSVLLIPSSLGKSPGLGDSKQVTGVLARDVGCTSAAHCSTLSLGPMGGRRTVPIIWKSEIHGKPETCSEERYRSPVFIPDLCLGFTEKKKKRPLHRVSGSAAAGAEQDRQVEFEAL